ncbi:MAG: hypothetical protein KJ856_12930 [Gammaproteobacteria bacterium]|nr:hypothetical protein [Gammaproteobacteria bacterium]MBU1479676.1 hypothetical protein [Gammaproteobacteria bacterium]MBU1999736.1 hypothetical protein [Gammaproteobacteria bacterium]MBU2131730.1 hypothetical protein [Gammaproteobacteria bacterium]MBU2187896.1 hypothetical protein [Gammaproteobacteria bacterium]
MNEEERNRRRADSFINFMDMLGNESDRGCVIVSAAIFDDILTSLLKKKLAPSLEKKDELFENGSAFSSFSSRIDLAYRLGIIRGNFRATLHMIRKIRNEFAHISEPKSFDTSSVKSRVIEIFNLNKSIMDSFSESMRDQNIQVFSGSNFIEVIGTRKSYEFLLSSYAAFILEAVNDIEPIMALE